MICPPCKAAADGDQYELHDQCHGDNRCECQHMPLVPSMISRESEETRRRGR